MVTLLMERSLAETVEGKGEWMGTGVKVLLLMDRSSRFRQYLM